jgi:hypothetical protein
MTKGSRKVVPAEEAKEAEIDALCKPWARPKGERGRLSAAQIEKKQAHEAAQRERCRDLLRDNEMLKAVNFDLKQGRTTAEEELAAARAAAEAIQAEADSVREELFRVQGEVDRIHAAAEVQADLGCMMPGELRPTLVSEQAPSGVIDSYQFQNEHGVFRLNFGKMDVKLEVIPSDPSRSPRTIDVSYRGIPDESVERLIGILGLPSDTPLPAEARRRLRRNTHDAAHDARMAGLLRYLTEPLAGGYGELLVLMDDEAMEAFKGHLSHTEYPAR